MAAAPPKTQLCAIDKQPPNAVVAIATLQDLFDKRQSALTKLAAKHLTADRLAKIAINCVSKSPKLLECTPESILSSVVAGAVMGLEAGGPLGHGYIVPRFNGKKRVMEANFLVGYRGLIDLARRSGHVLSIEADVVYDGDEWDCRKTEMGTSFTHVPCEDDDPGAVRLAYAVARLKDSPVPVVVVMLRRQIDAVRDRETRFGDSPWSSDYAEMAKKSSIRRICKYLPMSIEMASCLDAEAEEEAREIIDVRPAAVLKPDFRKKPESSQQTGDSSDVISGPPPQQTQVDTSESQEEQQEVIDNLSDVLAGIAALRTGAECNEHNERLRVAHWASEYDRKTAAAALKARWAVILKEEKLAMKSATNSKQAEPAKEPAKEATKEPARCDGCDLIGTHAVGCPQNEPAKPEWAKQDEKRSAEEASKAYSAVAPKGESVRVKLSDGTYADEGDEIQGRDREPGQEG